MLLNDQIDDGPRYIHCFFRQSFVNVYHLARGLNALISRFYFVPEISREDETPYFSFGTPQFHWRQMYNTLRVCMERFGLNELYEGYEEWTKPDLMFRVDEGKETRLGVPKIKPNCWMLT